MSADVVAIMAKKPVPGAVKTRLARAIGEGAACALAVAFLRDLHAALRAGPWRLVWAVHPPGADLSAELGEAVERIDQRGADLAERMEACFADLFAGGAERVVMIGADAPHLDAAALGAAFTALAAADAVLRPTRDGGYCLIGLRRPLDLFRGVPMSSAETCARTQARAAELGLELTLLPPTFDVDEARDMDDLAALIARGEAVLPATAAVLAARPR